MHTLTASAAFDKIGGFLINAALLAALPTAAFAIFFQAI